MNSVVFISTLSIGHHALLLVYGSYIAEMSIIQPNLVYFHSIPYVLNITEDFNAMSHKTTWGNNKILYNERH